MDPSEVKNVFRFFIPVLYIKLRYVSLSNRYSETVLIDSHVCYNCVEANTLKDREFVVNE